MQGKIIAIAEHKIGKIKPTVWETIGLGQTLANKLQIDLNIAVLGHAIDDLAEEISSRTGELVLKMSHPNLANYTPEAYCNALARLVSDKSTYLVLMGHTYQTMDFAPRLAAGCDRGFIPNCVDFQIEGEQLTFVRQVFNGKLNQHVGLNGDPPFFVSLQQGAFGAYEMTVRETRRIENFELAVPDAIMRRKFLGILHSVQGKVDLTQAEIIVAGGRGLGNKEKFQIILDLAEALGAGVGASRPVTDGGWLPKEHQIGSSGQAVSPKLYIACGISGAIQHLVGMTNSGCIVAINKDPNAPIFSVADYGIVGDVFQVVPVLTDLMRKLRKEA